MKKEELRYLQRLAELYPTIAKALGVSRSTVIKWLSGWRCDTDGLPDGAWYEDGHIHVDMAEPKTD